ncbi:MAG TPA: NAD(P)-binding protein, partial [Terriglobales bacterium]|nr:NAD(P)-binding protein [Terriglobales bacterium]
MGRSITRRDFLNGAALTLGAAVVPSSLFLACERHTTPGHTAPEQSLDYYPPAKSGLRGSHPGSFETAHSLRDGTFWQHAGTAADTGESYDLVIVGAGISGLSAAHFYRRFAGPKARVLILENHDDFGGHAKRNEFSAGNRMLLGFGGTYSIESPAPYSTVAKGLIEELGINVASFPKYVSKDLYSSLGLTPRIFFDQETFGADKLVVDPVSLGGGETSDRASQTPARWHQFLAEVPLTAEARRTYYRLYHDQKDYLPGLSS